MFDILTKNLHLYPYHDPYPNPYLYLYLTRYFNPNLAFISKPNLNPYLHFNLNLNHNLNFNHKPNLNRTINLNLKLNINFYLRLFKELLFISMFHIFFKNLRLYLYLYP